MRKRAYTAYPDDYTKILQKIRSTGEAVELKLTATYANSIRREFYRYRLALDEAAIDDTMASELFKTAKKVLIKIDPPLLKGEMNVKVTFELRPSVLGEGWSEDAEEKMEEAKEADVPTEKGSVIDLSGIEKYLD